MTTVLDIIGEHKVKSVESGETVPIKSFWQNQDTAIIFFRRWGCILCRLWAKELSEIAPVLNKNGVKLVGIGCEELGAKDFLEGKFFDGDLYYVEDPSTYTSLNFKRFGIISIVMSLMWKQSRDAILKGKSMGLPSNLDGAWQQAGGALLVGSGGTLLHHFKQTGPADHLPNAQILAKFGLDSDYKMLMMENQKFDDMQSTLKMLVLLLLGLLPIIRSSPSRCDACLGEICYEKNRIFTNFHLKSQLAIDRTNNILYFSFEDDAKDHFNAAYDLNKIRMHFLDMRSGFAKAVDQKTGNIYITTDKGDRIVIYNHKREIILTLKIKIIVNLLQYRKKSLYVVEKNKTSIIKYANGVAKMHIGLTKYNVEDFVVDKNNDIFFVNNFTLYRSGRNEGEPTVVDQKMYLLSVDKFDNAIFLDTNERKFYEMDYANNRVRPIGGIRDGLPFSFVFDYYNNPIYYDLHDKSLYSLSPNFGRCEMLNPKERIRLKKPFIESEPNVLNGVDLFF